MALSVAVVVVEDGSVNVGSFDRERVRLLVGSRGESVVAIVEHSLGVVAAVSGNLDSEVAEHGVGFPAT